MPPDSGTSPPVLLLTVDTLRSDHVDAAGYPVATMPFVADLLSGGVRFPNVLAPVPRTTQSLASVLTGAYPHTTYAACCSPGCVTDHLVPRR